MPDFTVRIPFVSRGCHAFRHLMGPYHGALGRAGAAAFFIAAAPGRVGIAMTSLGIVWLVHWGTGSFGAAGVVTGAFAITEACIGPQVARQIDRLGQFPVVSRCLVVHGLAIAMLVSTVALGGPFWLVVAAAVLAGASIPQVGALTSARWAWVLGGSPNLPGAFALESLSNGLAYMVGPTLVSTVNSFLHPAAGSVLAMSLILGGGFALILQHGTAPAPARCFHAETSAKVATLLQPAFAMLVGMHAGLGLFFGSMQVCITAFAIDHGQAWVAGPLNSIMSATSLMTGLLYGLRSWKSSPVRQLRTLLPLMSATCIPLLIPGTTMSLATSLAAAGLLLAPTLILLTTVTQAVIDRSALTQAFTWQNSASAAGIAIGSAVAGHVVATFDIRWGFGLAAAAITFAATVIWTGGGTVKGAGRNPFGVSGGPMP